MTDEERKLRTQIANEILEVFGGLAPYEMACKFVKAGPDQYDPFAKEKSK